MSNNNLKYPEDFIGKILEGDCLEILPQIPDNSIDLIVTDPPYFISQEGRKMKRINKDEYISSDFGKWDRCWKDDEDYQRWVEVWFKQCCRILKDKAWIYVFFDKLKIGLLQTLGSQYGIKTKTHFLWIKTNPVPCIARANFNSAIEVIWVGCKGPSKLKNLTIPFSKMNNYFITANASSYGETDHTTEKPLSLLKHLIMINSLPDDIVLDCFSGSGSVSIAASEMDRQFIGIEKDTQYCIDSNKRLQKYTQAPKLFKETE